jgi:hypothetical protein
MHPAQLLCSPNRLRIWLAERHVGFEQRWVRRTRVEIVRRDRREDEAMWLRSFDQQVPRGL